METLVSRSGDSSRHGLNHFWPLTVIRDSPARYRTGGRARRATMELLYHLSYNGLTRDYYIYDRESMASQMSFFNFVLWKYTESTPYSDLYRYVPEPLTLEIVTL